MDYFNNYNYGFSMQNNDFIGKYVSSYDEVLNSAAPINGSAIIFADLNNMMLYSKKNINGVPTVQPYKLQPIYQEAVKPTEPVNQNDALKIILDELESMKKDINLLKGAKPNE